MSKKLRVLTMSLLMAIIMMVTLAGAVFAAGGPNSDGCPNPDCPNAECPNPDCPCDGAGPKYQHGNGPQYQNRFGQD